MTAWQVPATRRRLAPLWYAMVALAGSALAQDDATAVAVAPEEAAAAVRVAERHAGRALPGATVERHASGMVEVTEVDSGASYLVASPYVILYLWTRPCEGRDEVLQGPAAITYEEALAQARAAARVDMGDEVEGLTWGLGARGVGRPPAPWGSRTRARIAGEGPLVGEPARKGLSPSCSMEFDLVSGRAVFFVQSIPSSREPRPVAVPRRQLEALARGWMVFNGCNPDDAVEFLRGPELRQSRDALTWTAWLSVGRPFGASFRAEVQVDGTTGEFGAGYAWHPPEMVDTRIGDPLAGTSAEMTLEEALPLFERYLGHPVDPGGLDPWVALSPDGPVAQITDRFVAGREVLVTVNLRTGRLLHWQDRPSAARGEPAAPGPSPPLRTDDASVIARVDEVARRYLGDEYPEGMTWTVSQESGGRLRVLGEAPPAGDPPRRGLGIRCYASVSTEDGSTIAYSQVVPEPEPLVAARIGPDQAVSAARAHLTDLDFVPADRELAAGADAYLVQRAGELWWTVALRGPEARWYVHVDATTGTTVRVAEVRDAFADYKPWLEPH